MARTDNRAAKLRKIISQQAIIISELRQQLAQEKQRADRYAQNSMALASSLIARFPAPQIIKTINAKQKSGRVA